MVQKHTFIIGEIHSGQYYDAIIFISVLCFSDEKTLYLTPEQEKDKSHFTDKEVRAGAANSDSFLWFRSHTLPIYPSCHAFLILVIC